MRVPTETQSITYFKELGINLEKVDPGSSQHGRWRLTRCSGDTEHHDSLLELWASWLQAAQSMINEDDTYRAFLAEYEKSDEHRKEEIRQWVEAYWVVPLGVKWADKTLTTGWDCGPDHLPRNWKSRVKRILSQPEDNLIFPYRALLLFKPEARLA